jgi:hypothetical protein
LVFFSSSPVALLLRLLRRLVARLGARRLDALDARVARQARGDAGAGGPADGARERARVDKAVWGLDAENARRSLSYRDTSNVDHSTPSLSVADASSKKPSYHARVALDQRVYASGRSACASTYDSVSRRTRSGSNAGTFVRSGAFWSRGVDPEGDAPSPRAGDQIAASRSLSVPMNDESVPPRLR